MESDCLYLVDEMLSGTNSREQIGLSPHHGSLGCGSADYGLVTTHDLALVKAEEELPGDDLRTLC